MANDWVLAQLFSQPIVVVAQKSYVGGKRFDSKGENYIDYLCRNELTSSAILVEIKTPETPLVDRRTYRENTHPAARDLAGGVQQLLQDSHSIARYADQLMRGSDAPRVDAPKLLLIAGLASKLDENMMRSFELFRSSVHHVEVLTYDEVVAKAERLRAVFLQDAAAAHHGNDLSSS